MVNNGTNGCLLVCFYPLPMLALAFFPQVGLYIGDLLSCLYLLPQVIEKFMRRNRREKWLTRFEIGNWTCISLWVYYMDLYPHNVFLTSPKPIVVIIYSVAILLQLGVLIYLEIKYKAFAAQHEPDDQPAVQPAQIPRKITDIFRRYTVSMKDSKVRRKLVSDQCAICIEDFEVQSKEKLYKAPCGHFFHAECLKSWGKKQLDCPVCRAQLPAFGWQIYYLVHLNFLFDIGTFCLRWSIIMSLMRIKKLFYSHFFQNKINLKKNFIIFLWTFWIFEFLNFSK